MTVRLTAALVAILFTAAGCSPVPVSNPTPTILPGRTGGVTLGPATLRLLLIDRLGPLWYCDRDEYPVGRDEGQAALNSWPEMQAENELMRAIAARLAIDIDGEVSDSDKLALYRQWKLGLAVQLHPIGDHDYRFDYLAQPPPGRTDGLRTAGIIRDNGDVSIEQQAAAGEPICPICLSRGTRIDTPTGPVAVEDLRLGDPVWTLDSGGQRVPGTVIALGSIAAPASHRVVLLVLADGRSVTASPGHPLADGRSIAEVGAGATVDGSLVKSARLVPYTGGSTFDLVASGETGAYFAGGIPLGSTLRPD
jgi:hypothetical protein